MDYKKINAENNTITRDVVKIAADTENVYETVSIIAKRANQISLEMKHELEKKLKDFESAFSERNEEVTENPEQIQLSEYYERLPKPTLIATQEYIEHRLIYRNPSVDKPNLD